MHGLELQTPVHEIKPRGTLDIHRRPQLPLRETLRVTQVGGRHAPVAKRDLHVQGHGDDVADEHEGDTQGPGGDAEPEEAVAEEKPVTRHEQYLDRTSPGG